MKAKRRTKHQYKIGYILGYFHGPTMRCFYYRECNGWQSECKHATIYKIPGEAEDRRRKIGGGHNKKQMFITKCYYEIKTEKPRTINKAFWGHAIMNVGKKTETFKELTRVNPVGI